MTEIRCDIVLPYVTSDDPYWLGTFKQATGEVNPSPYRFRSWGALKYLLRGIEKYMPFIRDVILVVSRKSQVPCWVNEEHVRVVYHEEFIPKQFLPTFNSCTIESFLYNISGLSEQFLYFNDDIFPTSSLQYTDFFFNGKPNIGFHDINAGAKLMFVDQCRSSLNIITDSLNIPRYPEGHLLVPAHSVTPMLRSTILNVGQLCKDYIPATITPLRAKENVNQYMYSYYAYIKQLCNFTGCAYGYINLDDNTVPIQQAFENSHIKLLCVNDIGRVQDYAGTKAALISLLESIFPISCKYEK